jgi:hypothetical protein
MSSVILSGIMEGLAQYDVAGATDQFYPFQNRLAEIDIQYSGELVFAESFSAAGVSGKTAACLNSEEAMITVTSSDFTWGYLQQAFAQVRSATTPSIATRHVQETFILGAAATTYTLANTPSASTAVNLIDSDGVPYTGFTVTGTNVTAIPTAAQGKELTFAYQTALGTPSSSIFVGSSYSERLSECTLYGRVRVCGNQSGDFGTLLWVAPRAVLKPQFSGQISSGNVASASLEFNLLRGTVAGVADTYLALFKLPAVGV